MRHIAREIEGLAKEALKNENTKGLLSHSGGGKRKEWNKRNFWEERGVCRDRVEKLAG